MKGIVFTTFSPDTEKLLRSFTSLGHEAITFKYTDPTVDMVGVAAQIKPDIIIYIGAVGARHVDGGAHVPDTETLCRINHVAPMVHLCSDAADWPWWPILEEYHAAGAFKLQVTIDGNYDNPIARFTHSGRVALTPTDQTLFINAPWSARNNVCGFAGGGGARCDWIYPLKNKGLLTWYNENGVVPYDQFCTFYPTCQLIMNDARTGSGLHRHMKGRFVEASFAGCCLIEPRDSPAKHWFEPDVDFLQWESTGEAEAHIVAAGGRSAQNEAMGQRLRNKMMEKHSAQVFWGNIMSDMGL
jgi:hypothetical protein